MKKNNKIVTVLIILAFSVLLLKLEHLQSNNTVPFVATEQDAQAILKTYNTSIYKIAPRNLFRENGATKNTALLILTSKIYSASVAKLPALYCTCDSSITYSIGYSAEQNNLNRSEAFSSVLKKYQ